MSANKNEPARCHDPTRRSRRRLLFSPPRFCAAASRRNAAWQGVAVVLPPLARSARAIAGKMLLRAAGKTQIRAVAEASRQVKMAPTPAPSLATRQAGNLLTATPDKAALAVAAALTSTGHPISLCLACKGYSTKCVAPPPRRPVGTAAAGAMAAAVAVAQQPAELWHGPSSMRRRDDGS